MDQEQNQTPETPMQAPTVGFPTPQQEEKKGFNLLIPIILLLLVVFGGIGFFIFKSSRSSEEEPSPTPSLTRVVETSTPTSTPESTPTFTPATVDRAKIKVQVLNGTGTPGDAGSVQSALASLGYKSIETGNASPADATKTTVTFDTSLPDSIVTEVTNKLKSIFKEVTSRSAKLSEFQVQITTGPKKGVTATTTPTTTSSPTTTKSPTPTASASATPKATPQ